MKYFLIFSLLFISSVPQVNILTVILLIVKKFSEFTNLSSCALKKIQKDCNDNINCRNGNTRFVDAIKRLQIMVQNNEISDNEAMFRYYNLIDYEESKFEKEEILIFQIIIIIRIVIISRG